MAIDAARTCIRLGCEAVTIVYRRTRSEMPADEEEVEQAEEEGVHFSFLTIPVEVRGADGKITSLHCLRAELGPADESGRRRPVPVEGSDHQMEVDAVIPAIGQGVDSKWLEPLTDLQWTRAHHHSCQPGDHGNLHGGGFFGRRCGPGSGNGRRSHRRREKGRRCHRSVSIRHPATDDAAHSDSSRPNGLFGSTCLHEDVPEATGNAAL